METKQPQKLSALCPNAPKKNCSLRHQKLSALVLTAPKKNCDKEFLGVKRLRTKSRESFLVVELFCLSGTQRNSSNYFSVHASFGSFLEFIPIKSGLRKEQLKNLFWSLSRCITGLRKEHLTLFKSLLDYNQLQSSTLNKTKNYN